MNYNDFQNLTSSEKLTLAVLGASKRLMGWVLHSGSVYKITNFPFSVITSIQDRGNAYTEVSSVGAIVSATYYFDRTDKTLYLETPGAENPNSHFIVVGLNIYLANVPIALANDLSTGYDVFWEPLIKSTSSFGVSIDTIAQTSEAIEGSGTITLNNDFDFWPTYFDKLTFENQPISIYSYHRSLDPSEAQIIFKGTVEKKAYTSTEVSFSLVDQFAQMRAPIPLAFIGDLGARTGTDLDLAYQRMILGRVSGHVPTNLDQVLDGYPLTGTVSIAVGDLIVTGSSTLFLSQLSPNDQLVLNGVTHSIASIASNTSLTLSDVYAGDSNIVALSATVVPDQPKRTMNRIHLVAGHALREPTTVTTTGSSIELLFVASTRDIYAGDTIYIGTLGSGAIAIVDEVIGSNYIRLATSLAVAPLAGVAITRPAVQNVRIADLKLQYYRDYTFNASTATLTLTSTAESNASPIYQTAHNVTFNGTTAVTGSGFQAIIKPGYMLGMVGHAEFFEVMSVDSDTALTLRTAASFSATAAARYQSFIFDPSTMVISLDAFGRTDDGTTSGVFLKTAPALTYQLLVDAGLSGETDAASFTDAAECAYQEVGLVLPDTFDGTTIPIYRDVMNQLNTSVFGAIVQNSDFKFKYELLEPNKPFGARRFSESDIIQFQLTATIENAVKTTIVIYATKEYNYLTLDTSVSTQQSTSDNAQYLLNTDVSRTFTSCLINETDANILAARWSFLLEDSNGRLSFTTKLQGQSLEIGDIIEVEHRKFYERHGTGLKRKIVLVESVTRNGLDVMVSATDLSGSLNSVAMINDFTDDWVSASDDEHQYGGYITDQYGLINNDEASFDSNLIW